MLLDLINVRKLRRALVYVVLLAAVFLVQDTLVSRIKILGIQAMLVPAVITAIGLHEGASWGAFTGMGAGWFMDRGYSEHVVLFMILLAILGFASGVLGKYYMRKGLLSFLALAAACLAVITFCQMLPFLFTDTNKWIVLRTGAIQLLWSIPWAIPLYYPCRAIAARSMQ